ncbi:uncharacterized protein N7498_001392 [Penicillium cinerascens]|uniref:Uncharacterized protein n=1 Tax=Penicillium cinerascens TaxID=70096 RepID=A0A9W9NIL0_9EURO|nr:uncharacterized protein N7498_001392 [Penicillium cinerascens]KAJ5219293.1 hypothetical protein N7498_001392 [Penicillium cinerascens]
MATPGTAAKLLGRVASQVYIKTFPAPKNLSERRQVLASLQKFGEVTTFLSLKYQSSRTELKNHRPILAIFDSGDAADRARAASPITVTLQPDSSANSSSTKAESQPQTISCTIEASMHDHDASIQRNPFHGTYGTVSKHGTIWQDMMGPKSRVPLRGLADVLQSSRKHSVHHESRSGEESELFNDVSSLIGLWEEGMQSAETKKEDKESETETEREKEEDKPRTGLKRVSRQMQRKESEDESDSMPWERGY